LPGSVVGDVVKAAALARGQSRRTAAVATVIMDRLIALWALAWVVAVLGSVFRLTG
jgi:glycosyltransferase 2 family protein